MQSDEIIWQVINLVHCRFKAKMQTQNFCRNEYNVTGCVTADRVLWQADTSQSVKLMEEEPEVEYVEGYEMEEEDDDAMEDFALGASRMSDSEDDDDSEEDVKASKRPPEKEPKVVPSKKKRRPHVEVEYEEELEMQNADF